MPADPLCNFTLSQLTAMMKQVMDYNNQKGITFWSVNSHIPSHRRTVITLGILGPLVDNSLNFTTWRPNWPADFPIYSPYAVTKGEGHGTGLYSQVRFSGDGKKYYCHRAAYVHQHGSMSLGTEQEVSHTRFLGLRTSRNVNPRHLLAELGRYNKARHHCHLYIDVRLRTQYLPLVPNQVLTSEEVASRIRQFNEYTMPTCAVLHHQQMCSVDWYSWAKDFAAGGIQPTRYIEPGQATPYETQYETDVEANERLNSETGDTTEPGNQNFGPNSRPSIGSSFGPYYQ